MPLAPPCCVGDLTLGEAGQHAQEQRVVNEKHPPIGPSGQVGILGGDLRYGALVGATAKRLQHGRTLFLIKGRPERPDDGRSQRISRLERPTGASNDLVEPDTIQVHRVRGHNPSMPDRAATRPHTNRRRAAGCQALIQALIHGTTRRSGCSQRPERMENLLVRGSDGLVGTATAVS